MLFLLCVKFNIWFQPLSLIESKYTVYFLALILDLNKVENFYNEAHTFLSQKNDFES